jgi:NADPH-dependent 2,4-dienoyl-CoA reductase/sulfur reductase-like enzyme
MRPRLSGTRALAGAALLMLGAPSGTLIEPAARFYTCPFSNLVLGGLRDMASIGHGYDELVSRYDVTHVRASADAVDTAAKTVTVSGGDARGRRQPDTRLGLARRVADAGSATGGAECTCGVRRKRATSLAGIGFAIRKPCSSSHWRCSSIVA